MQTKVLHPIYAGVLGVSALVSFPASAQETAPETKAPAPAPPKTTTTKTTTTKTTTTKTPRARGTAYLRVLHALPDGPNIDVYVDNKKTLSDVAFKTLSDYLPLPSGRRSLAIHESGKPQPLVSEKKTFTADKFYTLAAVTTAGQPALFTQNESTGKVAEGKAQLRVYHLSPVVPSVDITAPSTRKTKAGYARWMQALAYKKGRSRQMSPGTHTLQVRVEGKVLKETPLSITAGQRYSAFIIGKPDGTGNQALDILVKPAATRS